MILPVSNLKFIEFYILKSSFEFIPPGENFDVRDIFDQYRIELDFGKREDKKKNKIILEIFTKADINFEPELAGYRISAEGVGIFELKIDESLSKDDINNLKDVSSLSITINALRNYISQMTSHSPFGKFTLPAVNVHDLIKQKIASQK